MNAIVPLCLYTNGRAKTSLISLPRLIRENDTDEYICPARENLEFVKVIYVIDYDIRPIPRGLDLICVKNAGEITLSIESQYDPFNIDDNCLRFMAWLEPTPNTVPLFIYDTGNGVYVSLKKEKGLKKGKVSVIHVLENSNIKFAIKDERCIPDKNGIDLRECSIEASFPKGSKTSSVVYGNNSNSVASNILRFFLLFLFIGIMAYIFISQTRKKRKRKN
jgi:hypothetical protein